MVEIQITSGYHLIANRIRRNNVNMSATLLLFRKAFFEVLGQRTNLMRVGDKIVSSFGQCDRMIDPLKQKTTDLILQLFDLE